MSMKAKDLIKQEIKEKFNAAMQSDNQEDIVNAFVEMAEDIQQSVLDDFKEYQQTQDSSILQARGVHELTSEENKFYQTWINAAKSNNPRQEITNLNIALPFTVIDNVMEDLRKKHPLLDIIDFQNMTAVRKMIYNKQGKQLAHWGKITSAIVKELEGSIGSVDVGLNKLTAFMPVAKDMLEVGPKWVDAYVRAVLSEAISYGLEEGIINGTGIDMPIGMIKDVSEGVSVNGVTGYPNKELISLNSFNDVEIGSLFAKLATNPITGEARDIDFNKIVLIVNPLDYYTKVAPAIVKKQKESALYGISNPFEIKNVITSSQMERDRAVLGIASKYAMGLGSGSNKGGKIEYSDEYKFLEDERYYIIKLIGNGRSYDNNAFLYLDISRLRPEPIKVDNTIETLKAITITSAAGTETGNTTITTTNELEPGNSYVYKVGVNVVAPVINQVLTNWTAWDGASDITAETGKNILVAEINGAGQVKGLGKTVVTSRE